MGLTLVPGGATVLVLTRLHMAASLASKTLDTSAPELLYLGEMNLNIMSLLPYPTLQIVPPLYELHAVEFVPS